MKNLLMLSTFLRAAPLAFMSDGVETITVKSANGPVIMNKRDFDEANEKKAGTFTEHKETAKERKAAAADADEQAKIDERRKLIENANFGVIEKKHKFYVVDQNNGGKAVNKLDGIDPAGYVDQKTAWEAVFKVKSEATGAFSPTGNITPPADGDDANETGDGKEPGADGEGDNA